MYHSRRKRAPQFIGFRTTDMSAPLVIQGVPFLVLQWFNDKCVKQASCTFFLFDVKYSFFLSAFNSKDWQGICKRFLT